MKKFINKMTGTTMWVDDSREDEYKKLGHRMEEPEKKKQLLEEKQEVAPVQPKKKNVRKK